MAVNKEIKGQETKKGGRGERGWRGGERERFRGENEVSREPW